MADRGNHFDDFGTVKKNRLYRGCLSDSIFILVYPPCFQMVAKQGGIRVLVKIPSKLLAAALNGCKTGGVYELKGVYEYEYP